MELVNHDDLEREFAAKLRHQRHTLIRVLGPHLGSRAGGNLLLAARAELAQITE
jgi:hypothetical protein